MSLNDSKTHSSGIRFLVTGTPVIYVHSRSDFLSQEAIVSHGLVGKVLAKTSLPAANVLDILKVDRRSANIRTMVESLRSRAFLCINNLVQALAVEDLGGPGILLFHF